MSAQQDDVPDNFVKEFITSGYKTSVQGFDSIAFFRNHNSSKHLSSKVCFNNDTPVYMFEGIGIVISEKESWEIEAKPVINTSWGINNFHSSIFFNLWSFPGQYADTTFEDLCAVEYFMRDSLLIIIYWKNYHRKIPSVVVLDNGQPRYYFFKNGSLKSIRSYYYTKNGMCQNYFSDGKLKKTFYVLKNNSAESSNLMMIPGEIEAIEKCSFDAINNYKTYWLYDGEYIEYFHNGSIKIDGKYSKGLPIGDWVHYNKKGIIIQKKYY